METQFPDLLIPMVALSLHIKQKAQSGSYDSINALHDDYDWRYETHLSQFPNRVLKVGMELSQFAVVQTRWWPQCLKLPDQAVRLNLVKAVVEAVIENREGSPSQLWAAMKRLVDTAKGGLVARHSDDDLFEE